MWTLGLYYTLIRHVYRCVIYFRSNHNGKRGEQQNDQVRRREGDDYSRVRGSCR